MHINPLTPNDLYIRRTAPLTSKRCILCIYSTNVGSEYFKHALYSPFFSLQNAVCFITLSSLVPVLFTFYIEDVLKLKNNNNFGAKRLNSKMPFNTLKYSRTFCLVECPMATRFLEESNAIFRVKGALRLENLKCGILRYSLYWKLGYGKPVRRLWKSEKSLLPTA
jgi:hypothetical protein